MTNENSCTKEFIEDYVFTTIGSDRSSISQHRINGEIYFKKETLQAVTFVGAKYRENNPDGTTTYKLYVGMSLQNPKDKIVKDSKSREIAIDVAAERCRMNPMAVMEVTKWFDKTAFNMFAEMYLSTMKLNYIRKDAYKETKIEEAA